VKRTYESAVNIICASCGCCYHDITEFDNVPSSYEPLRHLSIPENINIPWNFSCGIEILDRNRIYINKCRITADGLIRLYHLCGRHLSQGHRPRESEANHRWIGPVPEEGGKRRLMCFEVEGTVVNYFLRGDSKYGHSITVCLSPEDILSIKNIVRGAPNHSRENFQWPIYNNVAKLKSNPDPLQPNAPFSPILDAGKINDFKNHNSYLEELAPYDVRKDMRVSVEYTPVLYQGGKDYNGACCSLDLYSITALKMEGQILHYDTSSPSKRARHH
jgi:hypothetical protein